MADLSLEWGTLVYDIFGEGPPIVLVAGCGQPAVAWHLEIAPLLADAGFQVITYDNRGVAPTSSPPAPYSVAELAGDTLALMDHLGLETAYVAGHSMGGWIAETLAIEHPERLRGAVLMGSCNMPTAWEVAITTVEVEMARQDITLFPLFYACETLRYLPNTDLMDDDLVSGWLSFTAEMEPWANPGRQGQYEACIAWSTGADRGKGWPSISVPTLVLGFEHDIDSPPAKARAATAQIPGARYVEVPESSHIGIVTHGAQVAALVAEFCSQ